MVNKSLGLSICHVGKNLIHFLLEVIQKRNSVININVAIRFSCEIKLTIDGLKVKLVIKVYI